MTREKGWHHPTVSWLSKPVFSLHLVSDPGRQSIIANMLALTSACAAWLLPPRPLATTQLAQPLARTARVLLLQEGFDADFNEADFDFSVFNDALLEETGRVADAKEAAEAEFKAEQSTAGWRALEGRLPSDGPQWGLSLSWDAKDVASAPELRRDIEAPPQSREAKVAAARAIIGSRDTLVAAATDTDAARAALEVEDAPFVDEMLREACRRLLATEDDPMDGSRPHLREVEIVEELDTTEPFRAKLWAQAAKLVGLRYRTPDDMDDPTRVALRATLLQLSSEAEAIAWRGSGGLL
eukprot:3101145-Prymnesium_polylepis.1